MPSAKKPNKVMRGSTRGGKKVREREEGARRVAARDEVPIHVSDAVTESDGEAAPAQVVKQVARGRKKRPTKNSSKHKGIPRAAETTATPLVERKQVQEIDVARVGNQPAHKDESQTATTIDTDSMQSQEPTSFLMSTSRPDLADYTRMKKNPHVRVLHLKLGVECKVTQSRHLIGTIAYVTGTEVKKSCNRCAGDYEPFPKCIIVEGELNSACAACFYAGKEKRCIFPPELEPESPPPISAGKEIADAVQARFDLNNQAFLAMTDEPRLRNLDVRHTFDNLDVYCERGATAAMAYMKGEEQNAQCTRCADEKGPFQKCVVFEGELDGVCASCYYAHKCSQCIFPATYAATDIASEPLTSDLSSYAYDSDPSELSKFSTSPSPPPDTRTFAAARLRSYPTPTPAASQRSFAKISAAPSKNAGALSTKPVTRKRKANANDDNLSSKVLPATKKRNVEKVGPSWTQAIQKMNKYVRKLERVNGRLGKIKATDEVQGSKGERLIHQLEKYAAKLEIVHAELKDLMEMNSIAN